MSRGLPPWPLQPVLSHQEANVGPRKLFAGGLVLAASATAWPYGQANADALITHPVTPDLADGQAPTATFMVTPPSSPTSPALIR